MKKYLFLLLAMLSLSAMAQTSKIYTMAEEMPHYARGERFLADDIKAALVYPQDAKDQNAQGRVMVQFVVELDGSLSHFKIMRSGGLRSMDNEAIRILSEMPDESWIPAKQNGQNVRCYYTQTINFRL